MSEPQYEVLESADFQYSIWPAGKESPAGWKAVGKTGTEAQCIAYIQEVWKDERPRRLMEEHAES